MHLTPEEKAVGKENFQAAIGSPLTRREFLQGSLAAGVTVGGAGLGAYYYGYAKELSEPVRVGFIGTGDEGGVLIGAHNPDFVQITAISDIRPYNQWRAFHGDQSSAAAYAARPGLMHKYGWTTEEEAKTHVKQYHEDYHELLDDPDIEGVVIALPLHLHAKVAIEALQRGKHVLTEKLMGHSVHECKEMARWADKTWADNNGSKGLYLATGHQRHYNVLYDNAIFTIQQGLIGDIHHIRAQWHRGNLPGHDSWSQPLPEDLKKRLASVEKALGDATGKRRNDLLKQKEILTHQIADEVVDAEKYDYQTIELANGHHRSALEELIRWRLWDRTGGGLMAELGSHQLDAASLFISALQPDGGKVMPLTVTGVGGRHIFPLDRDCEDHVYCSYEFPAPQYAEDPNKKIVVTYSSINGNGFGGYGEVVMGTAGTLILEREKDVMLFKESSTATKVKVSQGKAGPTLDTTETGGDAVGKMATDAGDVSRGYREEMEHWAWCIRNTDPANQPKCKPKVALADAVIALSSTIAMRERRQIEFDPAWFDIESDETPEGVTPSRPS